MTAADEFSVSVRIEAPPEFVFPYLTDPHLLRQWIGGSPEMQSRVGGVFAIDFSAVSVRGTFVEIDPPHRLVFTWGCIGREDFSPGSTSVEIVLTSDGSDTIVELTHRGLPPIEVPGHLEGWPRLLDRLAEIIVA